MRIKSASHMCVCVNECPLKIAVLHHATAVTGGTDVVATAGVVQCFSHQIGRVSSTSHSTPSCCLGVHSRPALSDLWRSEVISCVQMPPTSSSRWQSGSVVELEVAQLSCWLQPVIVSAITALVRRGSSKYSHLMSLCNCCSKLLMLFRLIFITVLVRRGSIKSSH